jgi:hypothetical protein
MHAKIFKAQFMEPSIKKLNLNCPVTGPAATTGPAEAEKPEN